MTAVSMNTEYAKTKANKFVNRPLFPVYRAKGDDTGKHQL